MKLPKKSYMSSMKSNEGKRLFELYFSKKNINHSQNKKQNNSPKTSIDCVVKDCEHTIQPKKARLTSTQSFDIVQNRTKSNMSLTDILNYYNQEGVVGEE